jgi:hypothetical protein
MVDLRWLAGFFDGEGNTSLSGFCRGNTDGRGRIDCQIAQADSIGLKVLLEVKEFLSSYSIRSHVYQGTRPRDDLKPIYRLQICGWVNAIRFLELIYPYLKIKRQRAEDVIRYSKVFPAFSNSMKTKLSWSGGRRKGACIDPIVLAKRREHRRLWQIDHRAKLKIVERTS